MKTDNITIKAECIEQLVKDDKGKFIPYAYDEKFFYVQDTNLYIHSDKEYRLISYSYGI